MVASCSHSVLAPARRSFFQCHPWLEPLEGRLLMAGLDLPQLASRPGAAATLFLDFDGHVEASWGSFSNISTPAYDRDGDPTAFSTTELASINEIWARVAEDFAPFNVNVTTVAPASFAHGQTLTVVIGGSWSDWYGKQANGVSFLNGFSGTDPNVGYVFAKNIGGGFPKWVSEQVSHEAGHSFGLMNQSSWSGTMLQSELNSGSGDWAPIMGTGNFAARTTWHNGTTHDSPTSFQDDMAILAGAANGFGYVADDYADSLATASQLPISGSSVNLTGLIGQNGDQDVFKFTTAGGNLSFNLSVAHFGNTAVGNLDSVLELRDANGQVVAVANDTTSGVFDSALSANVAAGTYYLVVRSSGGYGNVGQYTLTGNVVPGVVTAPEISVLFGNADLTSGGSANFGSTLLGSPVTQTFTVQNLGNDNLTLTSLNGAAFPVGFSLVSNLPATALAPGQSTTFTVQLDAAAAGSFGGTIHLLNNDADEGSFDIVLSGTVTQPVVLTPEIRVWANGVELASGDSLSFGSTLFGTPVSETFTIQNVGNGDLLLSQLANSNLPPGYSLVQALGSTTLHSTDFTTFVVQLDATARGPFGGVLHVLSNDSDEGSFDVNLSGAVTAPEIRVFAGSTELTSGDAAHFGSTPVGTPITQTFTIQNAGDGNLFVSGVSGSSLPAGFSLVTGFGDTTLVPGASVIVTVQLDAAAAGAFGGTLHVLNSDADEGSFDIVLDGVVTAPEIRVFAGDLELTSGDSVDLGTTVVGAPLTQTITIQNAGNGALAIAPVDGSSLPAGFILVSNVGLTTLAPGESTTFTVQFLASARGAFAGTLHLVNSDADEGSFSLALGGVVTAPEISVFLTSTELQSGETVDFGATQTGTSVLRTVTVTNVGDANLSLSPIDPSTLPAGFSLVSDLGSLTLAPGQSTTFTLQFNAAAAGTFSGVLHLLNGDADEGSFNLTLQGTASDPLPPLPPPAPPTVQTIDNGAAGFTATGNWHAQGNKGGFEQDIQFAEKAEKNAKTVATATWTFTGLAAGQYRIAVTAPTSPSYASDAPFSVFDGTTLLRTVQVNQKNGRGDFTADGARWENLGSFTIRGNTLVVQLTNRANGHVVADAVRIEQVMPSPDPPSCDSHQHDDKDHDKGDVSHQDNKGPHKSAPSHRPAPHVPQTAAHGKSKPAPKHPPQDLLHDLAKDVAHHHNTKSHK